VFISLFLSVPHALPWVLRDGNTLHFPLSPSLSAFAVPEFSASNSPLRYSPYSMRFLPVSGTFCPAFVPPPPIRSPANLHSLDARPSVLPPTPQVRFPRFSCFASSLFRLRCNSMRFFYVRYFWRHSAHDLFPLSSVILLSVAPYNSFSADFP